MRTMQKFSLVLLGLLLSTSIGNCAIWADYLDSSWEEQFKVTDLQSIEMWEQPKTKYTPKNLVSEQQVRYSGKNGTNSYESYTFHVTDYDTKITGTARGSDGSYYIQDNLGQYFKTGEQGLTAEEKTTLGEIPEMQTNINNNTANISKVQNQVNDNTTAINENRTQIKNNTTAINNVQTQVNNTQANVDRIQSQVNGMQGQINSLGHKINNIERRMEQGLATVTALTALHPNPRHKGKTQISVGSGMYADNVAGAIGIFHYLNDRVMLNAGAAYGGDTSWAGNVGITIGL